MNRNELDRYIRVHGISKQGITNAAKQIADEVGAKAIEAAHTHICRHYDPVAEERMRGIEIEIIYRTNEDVA